MPLAEEGLESDGVKDKAGKPVYYEVNLKNGQSVFQDLESFLRILRIEKHDSHLNWKKMYI